MKRTPVMIGIAGASCSGKTRLANAIVRSYPQGDAVAVGLDSYYLDDRPKHMKRMNFDDPQALEKDLIVAHLTMLSRGESIRKPVYDYTVHRRCADTELIRPKQLVVVEGLYTFYWEEIRNLLDVKIFMEMDHAACLQRRLARDTLERGRTPDSVVRQYQETVRPMYDRHIHPTRRFADLVLDGADSVENLTSAVSKRLPE